MKNDLAENSADSIDQFPKAVSTADKTAQFLANENIFLAWVRTGLTLMSFGFVVNQFGYWFEEFSRNMSPNAQVVRSGASVPIGIGMVIFGGLLAILASWRYHKVHRQIKEGKVHADHGLVSFVTVLTLILTIVMVVFMFSASRQF